MIDRSSEFLCSWSHHVRILSFFLATLLFTSCSGPSHNADMPMTPGVGSIFVMEVLQEYTGIDSALKEELRVAARVTEMLFEGKEHVVQFAADTALSLMAYEPNGDISIYARQEYIGLCFVDGGWLRFPFGGESPVVDTLEGVPVSFADEIKNCLVTWTARPDGVEEVVIQGTEYSANRVQGELVVCTDSAGTVIPVQGLQFSTLYAPELRYVVRENIVSLSYTGEGLDTIGTSRRVLKSWQSGESAAE